MSSSAVEQYIPEPTCVTTEEMDQTKIFAGAEFIWKKISRVLVCRLF